LLPATQIQQFGMRDHLGIGSAETAQLGDQRSVRETMPPWLWRRLYQGAPPRRDQGSYWAAFGLHAPCSLISDEGTQAVAEQKRPAALLRGTTAVAATANL